MVRGVHHSLTEKWGTLELTLVNPNATDREARLLVFYSSQPRIQYGRDVWLPGNSILTTWMLIGPAPEEAGNFRSREMQALLYDRTDGQERIALRSGEERIRGPWLLPYTPSRTITSILMDLAPPTQGDDLSSRLNAEGEEILQIVRLLRANSELTPHIGIVQDNFLLPSNDAFDGVHHFVLATPRLADDPPGLMALRHWLEQGGKVWVMLDLVGPDTVARLLGEDSGFQVVDRTSLTTVRVEGLNAGQTGEDVLTQELEQPVNFVRVLLSRKYTVLRTVNGWPALCTRTVGRGKLVMTTLGARGWFRPRTATDPQSPYSDFPELPFALPAMDPLTEELRPLTESSSGLRDVFEPLVRDEVGYSIIGVGTAGLIFGGFLVALLAIGMGLRNVGRAELLVWLGPMAAVVAAGIFLVLGTASRRSVPPTMAVAQLINVSPRAEEPPVRGLFAVYRPDPGLLPFRSAQGGLLDFDMTGLEGQIRQFVMTDLDAWHWEGLAAPAGVREGAFRYSAQTDKPVAAVARFGPKGIEGRLVAGPFRGLTDALIQSPIRRLPSTERRTGRTLGPSSDLTEPVVLAVQFQADGTLSVGDEPLAPGQYLSAPVLTDRQQRRQAVYRRLLTETKSRNRDDRSLLMAWAEPAEMPFEPGIRTVGSALLAIPLDFDPTPPDTPVTVPRAFIPVRRMLQGANSRPTMEGQYEVNQHLRFQIPSSVLPMKVERARLFVKVNAPMRTFTVAGLRDDGPIPLLSRESPIDLITLDINQKNLLRLDEQGGLHFDITVSDRAKGDDENEISWRIEFLELEVVGRTLPDK
jgi:hypothetical protein